MVRSTARTITETAHREYNRLRERCQVFSFSITFFNSILIRTMRSLWRILFLIVLLFFFLTEFDLISKNNFVFFFFK